MYKTMFFFKKNMCVMFILIPGHYKARKLKQVIVCGKEGERTFLWNQ